MTLRVISYGGGVQSTALVVLAATGRLGPVDAALFCNVGDDSEHPATLRYVRDVAIPWAAERGLPVHELQKVNTRGAHRGPVTLWGQLMRSESRSIPIPMRMPGNGAPGTRSCTADFKIGVVDRWIREHGGTGAAPAEVMIGISVDELERAGRGKDPVYRRRSYPLLEHGLHRSGCVEVIRAAGLPIPPKSACFFCPYHRPATWAEQRRDEPELFALSQLLEDTLNDRRDRLGRDRIYLTRFGRRLSDAVGEAQAQLFDHDGPGEDGCDEGVWFV